MSVIEDSRKVLQDFIAPELRAIDVRLTALEKRFDEAQKHTDQRFDTMQKHTDQRFDDIQKHVDQRFDSFERRMSDGFASVSAEVRRLADYHDATACLFSRKSGRFE